MAYVPCSTCKVVIHVRPLNVDDFHDSFVEGQEPVYCVKCFKRKEQESKNKDV